MINLDDPKRFRTLVGQAHQVAMNMLRPISRKYDLAEHEYPKELDMLAAMIDGLAESGASRGSRCGRRAPWLRGRRRLGEERHQPRLGHVDPGDVLGRRRPAALHAAAGARQLRDRERGGRRAARAVRRRLGRHGDHRARHRLRLRQHQDDRCPRRRRVRPQRREDLRHLRRAGRPHRGVGDPRQGARPGGDQVVRGRQGHARAARRAARAQARYPRLRHRDDHLRELPGAEGEPSRLGRDRRWILVGRAGVRRRDGDLRQHSPPGRGDGHRLRVGGARPDPRAAQGRRCRGRLRPSGVQPVGGGRQVPPARIRPRGRPSADASGGLDGRQPAAQLARGLDGQGQGRPGRLRRDAVLRGAVRRGRLQ